MAKYPYDKDMHDLIANNEYYTYKQSELKGRETGGDSGGTDIPITISRDYMADTFQVGTFSIDSALQSSLLNLARKEGFHQDLR